MPDINASFSRGLDKGLSRLHARDPTLQGILACLTGCHQLFSLMIWPVEDEPFSRFDHGAYVSRYCGTVG